LENPEGRYIPFTAAWAFRDRALEKAARQQLPEKGMRIIDGVYLVKMEYVR
jgi:hypothetical protein